MNITPNYKSFGVTYMEFVKIIQKPVESGNRFYFNGRNERDLTLERTYIGV